MKYNPDIHHRQSIRLKGYNYRNVGAYFITICTWDRGNLFGKVADGIMILNENGTIVENTWFDLPNHNSNIGLDAFIIIPNHAHAINPVGGGPKPAPTEGIPLSEIVRQLKTFSAKRINNRRNTQGTPVWQRNYYEHIIRDEDELNKIREYIKNNPANWDTDENFMENT